MVDSCAEDGKSLKLGKIENVQVWCILKNHSSNSFCFGEDVAVVVDVVGHVTNLGTWDAVHSSLVGVSSKTKERRRDDVALLLTLP